MAGVAPAIAIKCKRLPAVCVNACEFQVTIQGHYTRSLTLHKCKLLLIIVIPEIERSRLF